MKRPVLIAILLVTGAVLLTGCSLLNAENQSDRAKNTARQLLENANVNGDEIRNRATDAVNEASGIIPEINVNASVTKTPPPKPAY